MVDTPLFHLCHPRKENSSKEELQDYIKSFKYE